MSARARKTSPLAIAAFVLGLCGMSLPAVVCGHAARAQIRRSRGSLRGHRLALAGLVLGYTVLALLLLALLALPAAQSHLLSRGRPVLTQMDANRLRSALITYEIEHGHYPGLETPAHQDTELESDTRMMKPLLGENPQGRKFFHPDTAKLSPDGGYVDGWGRPYRILLDSDGSRAVTWKGRRLHDRVIVTSAGPDGLHGSADDLGTGPP